MYNLNSALREWHVIYTRPKFEKKVYSTLTDKGINAFLPLRKVVRQWHDRKKKVDLPVFPSYLFVHVNMIEKTEVFNVPGFVKFISTGGIPDTISERRMQIIKQILSGDYEISNDGFEDGERVKVINGPLKDMEGELVLEKGSQRFAVKMEIVNKYVIASISPSDLMKISDNKAVA